MLGTGDDDGTAPVAALAEAHGEEAWCLAVVAGADSAAASRAAVHAVVIAAVEGGAAAKRPAILALARSWALSSPGAGADRPDDGGVVTAFWSLAEPLRTTLWCTDGLGLAPAEVARVLGPSARPAGAGSVARGLVRREVLRQWRARGRQTECGPPAAVLARVLAGTAPASEVALVDDHLAGCDGCRPLLAPVLDPVAVVRAGLPAAPALVAPARRAWREHVGAPRRTTGQRLARAAAAAERHRRPVSAVLALLAAGSFATASTRLAASTPALPLPLAVAPPAGPVTRVMPPFVMRRQAVVPPLAPEAAADPQLAGLLVPDLMEVTPVTPPPPPPPAPVPPPAPLPPPAVPAAVPLPDPDALLLAEPPPAVERPLVFDLTLPLPVLPFAIDLGPSCPSITIGPVRLAVGCEP